MNPYHLKAANYARYRWNYHPTAVEAIFSVSGLTRKCFAADLGAGTGILTRHLTQYCQFVYAIEPGVAMIRQMQTQNNLQRVLGCAEQIPLPANSLDLITAAQAAHWFTPLPTQKEIARVLKPQGWLAFLQNRSEPNDFDKAFQSLMTPQYGITLPEKRILPNIKQYFQAATLQQFTFSFALNQSWETVWGALTSASFIPDESHQAYPLLYTKTAELFFQFAVNNKLQQTVQTELLIGKVA
ncbi:MAG: hypothetical protein CVU39_01055 [Chloroflexi bacterium HGW-Chloroflexi-10]|nr:MAG: hypothetical protein CVU39_01055 [Chloroflexi bacterium HGW-Chloroflexi-10]